MKIFLSWSGNRSKEVATLLSEWIPRVIQSAKPWISTRDIEKGSLWSEVISDRLGDISTGIICLTQDNKEKPWISFEAGALAKGISTNRVCTLLIDLEPTDVLGPLAQFNHTNAQNKEDVVCLIQTLNDRLGEHKLKSDILDNALAVHWDYFEQNLSCILKKIPAEEPVSERKPDDILKEILENTRQLKLRVDNIEGKRFEKNNEKINVVVNKKLGGSINIELAKYSIRNLKKSGMSRDDIFDFIIRKFPNVSHSDILNTIESEFDE
ncbi:MAG: toll/interleukin-1 receptor domain-containing protein [Komagataeibacter hansenii]|nr:toll/interleukin-1 receptor domain-containing protein [Novacetimonas hansenii]